MSTTTPRKSSGTAAPPSQASGAVRWGVWVARRHRWVLGIWGVVLVAAVLSYPHLMSSLVAPDYSVTGSDSAEVADLIETNFTAAGAEQDVIVFDSETLTVQDPRYRQVVKRVLASVRGEPGVAALLGPTDPGAQGQISPDGHAAFASLGLNGDDRERSDRATDLQDAVESATGSGPVEANLTGYSPAANDLTEVENADVERAESVGLPIAFIVLLIALGAVFGAFVPLLTAVISLTATLGLLSLLVAFGAQVDALVLSIVTMIGVGVAIDYSLFILTRFQEELARATDEGRPEPVASAVGAAMTTSGRTIAFSGTIVMISLFSLFVVKAPLFQGIALGAVLVVACTLVAAWSVLPAMLAWLGPRVDKWPLPKKFRPAESYKSTPEHSFWARWARTVLAHPWIAIPAAMLLILFALPTLNLRMGIDLGISAISDTPSGKAEVVLADKFSPGLLSPTQILVTHQGPGALSASDLSAIDRLTTSLSKDERVDAVYSIATLLSQTTGQVSPQALARLQQDPAAQDFLAQTVNVGNGSNRTIVTLVPHDPIDSTESTDLVEGLRDKTIPAYTANGGPQMLVGGTTAQFADLSDESIGKLPLVMAIVLGLSFIYLLVIFRAVLIPAKAVLMNLLATAAAFGLVTWVFQEGHFEGLLGFTSVGFIQTYLPIMTFALLFGLSMDYEVFLIRRMQERWLETHDSDDAVATGLAHTARPIVAAAAIMAAVFGCFLVADVLELKQFGFALAMAVILDATLVRLLLVPAIMKVAGGANWWLPKSLERVLPRIRLD